MMINALIGEPHAKADPASRKDRFFILTCFVIVVLPGLLRFPMPAALFIATLILGYFGLQFTRIRGLSSVAKIGLIFMAIFVMFMSFGTITINSSACFFTLAVGLKMFEVRLRSEVYQFCFLSFYLLAVNFLFDQGLLSLAWQLLATALICGLLLSLNQQRRSTRSSLKFTGKLLLYSVPLTIVLFIFFPRSGPLWSVPLSSGSSRTGISDLMAPGDISKLAQSDERAFRVQFSGPIPPTDTLYWRGLLLDSFDGRTWRSSERPKFLRLGKVSSVTLNKKVSDKSYRVVMEATDNRWAFALAGAKPASSNIEIEDEGLIRLAQPAHQTTLYQLDHSPIASLPALASAWKRSRYLRLPEAINPGTREWVKQLQQRHETPRALVNAVLSYFRKQEFFYTLRPDALTGRNSIDDFLFNSRRGFCAHYAGALSFVARLAGIPSRVVVGYQGGERSQDESYLVVRQYDAHAWVELWLDNAWQRVDPVAAVAPERIEQGIRAAMREEGSFLENDFFSADRYAEIGVINWLRWRMDELNFQWQKWVVNYNRDAQSSWLTRWFNRDDLLFMSGVMVALSVAIFGLMYALAYWSARRQEKTEPQLEPYLRYCRFMEKQGIVRRPGEGPVDFCRRVSVNFPEIRAEVQQLTQLFISDVYAPHAAPSRDNKGDSMQKQILAMHAKIKRQINRNLSEQ